LVPMPSSGLRDRLRFLILSGNFEGDVLGNRVGSHPLS
jgi:hypothetical protein